MNGILVTDSTRYEALVRGDNKTCMFELCRRPAAIAVTILCNGRPACDPTYLCARCYEFTSHRDRDIEPNAPDLSDLRAELWGTEARVNEGRGRDA